MKLCTVKRKQIIAPLKRSVSSTSGHKKASGKPSFPAVEIQSKDKFTIPNVERDLNFNKTVYFSSHLSYSESDIQIIMSRSFSEIPPKEVRTVFYQKCKECTKICDFSSDFKDSKAKSNKAALLKHISQAFTIPHIMKVINHDLINLFFEMVEANLVRPFPPIKIDGPSDAKDMIQDSAWPHVSLVYQCLLDALELAKVNEFSQRLLDGIVNNTLSPDERERTVAKNVVVKIYNKCSSTRMIFRNRCAFLFSSGKCSAELLDFFCIVAAGFTPPLKNDLIDLFIHSILPLHCLSFYPSFQSSLFQVIARFISKADCLLAKALNYLNQHWPCSDRKKQNLFLNEYENLVLSFEAKMNQQMLLPFFRRINECITSTSPYVSCAALEIIQNPHFHPLISQYASSIYFMLIVTISGVKQNHWNDDTKEMASNTLEVLKKIEPNAFERATTIQKGLKSKKLSVYGISKSSWEKVIDAAKSNHSCFSNLHYEDLVFAESN